MKNEKLTNVMTKDKTEALVIENLVALADKSCTACQGRGYTGYTQEIDTYTLCDCVVLALKTQGVLNLQPGNGPGLVVGVGDKVRAKEGLK